MLKKNWLIRPAKSCEGPQRLSLFCFPFAGGGASIYRLWNNEFPEDILVYPVQYPGHEERISEGLFDDVEQMVSHFVEDNEDVFRCAPFALFGHSLGAKVAYEVSRQLADKGLFPEVLIVSASRAPLSVESRHLHELPEHEFINELKKMEGTPEAILQSKEFMALFLPILRADFAMDEKYVCEDFTLDCPLIVCYGEDDHELRNYDIRDWKHCASGDFYLEKFRGGHFYLKSYRNDLVRRVKEHLEKQEICNV